MKNLVNSQSPVSCRENRDRHSFTASSQPYCVFRNISRYLHINQENFRDSQSRSGWKNEVKCRALEQSAFFIDSVIDEPVPFQLLCDTIYDDINASTRTPSYEYRRNSLLALDHGGTSLLLHCGGQFMDELILRNTNFLQEHYEWKQQPGFSLNLGKGFPILQMGNAGKSQFGISANVLVRTRGELFHLRTVDISELADGSKRNFGHVLEPNGKWTVPNAIVDMTTSKNDWSFAHLIDKDGVIYGWNSISGIKTEMTHSFHQSNNLYPTVPPFMIESRCHPKLLYLARDHEVFNVDLRTQKPSKIFSCFSLSHSLDNNHNPKNYCRQSEFPSSIQGIRTHDHTDNLYFVSVDNAIMLLDSRFPKTHVFKESTYEARQKLVYKRINVLDKQRNTTDHVDVLLSSSFQSSQIHCHCFRFTLPQRTDGVFTNQSPTIHANIDNFDMLKCASSEGFQGSLRWEAQSFPTVDRTVSCIGTEFIVLPKIQIDVLSPNDVCEYCGMVVQQNSIGDVYVQKVNFVQSLNSETHSIDVGQVQSDEHLTFPGNQSYMTRSRRNPPMSENQGEVNLVNGALKPCKYPPIQINLPVSNRFHPPQKCSEIYSRVMSYLGEDRKRCSSGLRDWGQGVKAMDSVHQYFYGIEKMFLLQGLAFDPALIKDSDVGHASFPISSKSLRKFIPEDALMGRDCLLLIPRNIRRDLPQIPRSPNLHAISAFQRMITTVEEGEKLYLSHCTDVAMALRKSPMSLWEISKLIWVLTSRRIGIDILRYLLLHQAIYEESWCTNRSSQSSRIVASFYSDGCFIAATHQKDETRGDSSKNGDCRCLLDESEVKAWSNGLFGGRLNNKTWKWTCPSKYCMLGHMLIYSEIEVRRDDILLQIKNSTRRQAFFQEGKKLTSEVLETLSDSWDASVDIVYCTWPGFAKN